MTNAEAILVLKSTSVNLGRRSGKTAYIEALEMAITALENNSNDEVNNSTNNSTNEIENRVKGMTACRVPEDDCISRQAAIDTLKMDISIIPFAKAREYVRAAIETIYNRLEELPSVQTKQCDFEKQLHDMFDHIWYCEIDHPVFQDTVGDLMRAVIEAHYRVQRSEIIRCRDCRWRKDQSGSTAWLPCRAIATPSDFYCGRAERKTDGCR